MGEIHCDNSKQAYFIHWLDHSYHLSSSALSPPHSNNCKKFHCSILYKSINHNPPSSPSTLISLIQAPPSHEYPPHSAYFAVLSICNLLFIFKHKNISTFNVSGNFIELISCCYKVRPLLLNVVLKSHFLKYPCICLVTSLE
jgi:hypothetical protein